MRGLDGLSVLREGYPGVPVVVVSCADDAVTIRRSIDAGAMGFIPLGSATKW
ncbi:MAG TPA: hypothetical protein DIT03_02015 [Candidatus Accumulibacter sp.]|nr:hypothetical protein [Accumulibacter sp.]HCN67052.1 hypothetical protein [Accumulibacter sp.]HCV12304.1 hypothetical protein [Accumulibacter sp.]